MSDCPSREQLAGLLTGQSDDTREAAFAAHVETCERCQRVLDELSDEPDIDEWVRRALRGGEQPTEIDFPDRRIGPYRIVRLVGEGGVGIVYQATDERLNRTVAVKVLRPQLAVLQSHCQRFEREARTATRISHQNVVAVFDVGTAAPGSLPYLVMEYVDGETLSARIQKGQPLSEFEVARIVRDVANALDAAGVVHRDIKPSNIMLTVGGTVKVMDFGLARCAEDAKQQITLTGLVMGTPAYMSPEQIRARGEIDGRSDVFALGVMLYQLTTGSLPFYAVLDTETARQILEDEPRRPRRLNRAISRDLETITLKCLEKNADRRYPSAGELADDLNRFRSREPIRARPIGPVGRAWRWCQRKPALAASVTSVIVLLFITVVLLVSRQAQARRQAEAELAAGRAGAARLAAHNARRERFHQAAVLFDLEAMAYEDSTALRMRLMEDLQFALRPARSVVLLEGAIPDQIPPLTLLRTDSDYLPSVDRLLVCGGEGTSSSFVKLFNTRSFQAERKYDSETEEVPKVVRQVALSPDGSRFAAVDINGNLAVFSLETGRRLVPPIRPHAMPFQLPHYPGINEDIQDYVPAMCWVSDTALATVGYDWTVKMWQIGSENIEPRWQTTIAGLAPYDGVTTLVVEPDGKRLVGAGAGEWVRFWNVETGDEEVRIGWPKISFETLAFDRDKRWLATGSDDGLVVFWKRTAAEPEVDGRVQIGPSLTVDNFGNARKIELSDEIREPVSTLRRHLKRMITSLAFSPDGRWLAAALGDGTVSLIDVVTRKVMYRGVAHLPDRLGMNWIHVLFTRQGDLLSLAHDGTLRQWELEPSSVGRTVLKGIGHSLLRVEGSRAGAEWAALSADGTVVRWNQRNGEVLGTFEHASDALHRLAYNPQKRQLVATTQGGKVVVFDSDAHAEIEQFAPRETGNLPEDVANAISAVAVHPKGHIVATAWHDGSIDLCNLKGGRRIGALDNRGASPIAALRFRPDGKQLVACHADGSLALWDPDTMARQFPGRPMVGPQGPETAGLSYAISNGVWHLVQCGHQQDVTIWNAETAEKIASLEGHQRVMLDAIVELLLVQAAEYSPDGRWLATAGADGTLRIWQTGDYDQVAVISTRTLRQTTTKEFETVTRSAQFTHDAFGAAITDVAFSSDSRRILAVGFDGVPRVYDLSRVLQHARRPLGAVADEARTSLGLRLDNGRLTVATRD